MKLIIGLGNPGLQYKETRHNTGFILLDEFADSHSASWQEKSKFKAHTADIKIGEESVIIAKPQTFYNDSGQSVRAIKDFYKIDNQDILVVHDELALPYGNIRTRSAGSDAGNNGIKSISSHIGEDYGRVRVGVYNELRDKLDDADFVLSRFNKDEREKIANLVEQVDSIVTGFINNNFEATSYNI